MLRVFFSFKIVCHIYFGFIRILVIGCEGWGKRIRVGGVHKILSQFALELNHSTAIYKLYGFRQVTLHQ